MPPSLDEPDHARVDVVEHLRQLDPDSDEIGDLEEATVGEHLPRRPPVGEPPHLPLVQSVQRRPVRPSLIQRLRNQRSHRRISCEPRRAQT